METQAKQNNTVATLLTEPMVIGHVSRGMGPIQTWTMLHNLVVGMFALKICQFLLPLQIYCSSNSGMVNELFYII